MHQSQQTDPEQNAKPKEAWILPTIAIYDLGVTSGNPSDLFEDNGGIAAES